MILVSVQTQEAPASVQITSNESSAEEAYQFSLYKSTRQIQPPESGVIYEITETSTISVTELPAGTTSFTQLEDQPATIY